MRRFLAKIARWWTGPAHPCVRCRHYVPEVLWPDSGTGWDGASAEHSHCTLHQIAVGPRDTCPQWEATP